MEKRFPNKVILTAILSAGLAWVAATTAAERKPYQELDPSGFSRPTQIDNTWLPLEPGTRFVWQGTTLDEDGVVEPHKVILVVTDLTKVIAGVETRIVWDRDFKEDELEESEIAFFAQDDQGNVWNFGEYPEEYEDGELDAAPGWLHGFNGHGGIMMPADPKLGDPEFPQGWAPDVPWTDRAMVHDAGVSVKIPHGSFDDVIVFAERDLEEPDARQYKYYARGIGNVKISFSGDDTQQEQMELISVEKLTASELDDARKAALRLASNAAKHLPEIFGKTKPARQR